ncbi:MAG: Orotidine 5'-phosphate decarboxylase [Firmicutes bacterium]|nr:Orotidine 5'-phosphate decarboxylase [Bacillota bacterium]
MNEPFSRRLTKAILAKQSVLVTGLDPNIANLPPDLCSRWFHQGGETFEAAAECILEFNKGLIEVLSDVVVAVKPQLAFYECLGAPGMSALSQTISYAKQHSLLVIIDGKRNDIGSSMVGYADAYLGTTQVGGTRLAAFPADALTVNPYLGSDSITPLVESAQLSGTGVFVLVKTSNPSGSEIQNLAVVDKKVYEIVGEHCHRWGLASRDSDGYSAVGAVVGATYPREAAALRKIMPHAYFLVPGFGAQGAGPADVVASFNADGLGAVVNSSRDIIFAFAKQGGSYQDAARGAAIHSRDIINKALLEGGKRAW